MNIEIMDKNLIKSDKLNEVIKRYVVEKNIYVNSIPSGKGKRLNDKKIISWHINT